MAEENDKSLSTLYGYRTVAAAFEVSGRPETSFGVAETLRTPERLAEFKKTGKPLTVAKVRDWVAGPGKPAEAKPEARAIIEKIQRDAEALVGLTLTTEDRNDLHVVRLEIDNLLEGE